MSDQDRIIQLQEALVREKERLKAFDETPKDKRPEWDNRGRYTAAIKSTEKALAEAQSRRLFAELEHVGPSGTRTYHSSWTLVQKKGELNVEIKTWQSGVKKGGYWAGQEYTQAHKTVTVELSEAGLDMLLDGLILARSMVKK